MQRSLFVLSISCLGILLLSACTGAVALPTTMSQEETLLEIDRENAIEILASNETTNEIGVETWLLEILGEADFEGFGIAGISPNNELLTLFVMEQPVSEETTYHYLYPESEAQALIFQNWFMKDACSVDVGGQPYIYTCQAYRTGNQIEQRVVSAISATSESENQACVNKKANCNAHLSFVTKGVAGLKAQGWDYIKGYCQPTQIQEVCGAANLEEDTPVDIAYFMLKAAEAIRDHCSLANDPWCDALCNTGTFLNGEWCDIPQPPVPETPQSTSNRDASKPTLNKWLTMQQAPGHGGGGCVWEWEEWHEYPEPGVIETVARRVCR